MVDTGESRAVKAVRLRWIARVIFILWALFWLYFNIGSGIVEHEGPESMFWHLAVAAIILVAASPGLRSQRAGSKPACLTFCATK